MDTCRAPHPCHGKRAEYLTLSGRIVETRRLLDHFRALNPYDLHTLAQYLVIVANQLDAMADRDERASTGDAFP
jgi:hypothetical protein